METHNPAVKMVQLRKRFRLAHTPVSTLKGAVAHFRKRRYEDLWALKGIDLEVPRGETLAVIGRNGSGKSTMLGLVGKVYLPTDGTLEVNGKVAALLELGAGFHADLTGEQNVILNGVILGMREKEVRGYLDQIIQFAELEDFRDAPLRAYSAGMVMRLGFAVAIFTRPDILLIDEVLAVGDETFQAKCLREIREFQARGGTIVFVSHDMESVRSVASRVLWMSKGEIKMQGGVNEVVEAYLAESAALASQAETSHPH